MTSSKLGKQAKDDQAKHEQAIAAVFAPVARTRTPDTIVMRVRNAILTGELQTHQRLPSERELSSMFNVGRPTLREALRVLEALGLVEIRRGASGGIFVGTPNEELVSTALEAVLRFRRASIDDLIDFRRSFEAENAGLAAARATPAERSSIVAVAGDMVAAWSDPNVPWEAVVERDLAFHSAVAEATHNQVRVAIVLGTTRALQEAQIADGSSMSLEERTVWRSDEMDIALAIRDGESELAAELMRAHVETLGQTHRPEVARER